MIYSHALHPRAGFLRTLNSKEAGVSTVRNIESQIKILAVILRNWKK